MQKIIIAPDKFKGSLSSLAVAEAMAAGLKEASSSLETLVLPLADGGDGLLEIIRYYLPVTVHQAVVQGPLGEPVQASWLLSADGKTAYLEMAEASGLRLLSPDNYNCGAATTWGTGQLIAAALRAGVEEVLIGVGGSATNDGGVGMAAALGFRFLGADGKAFVPVGETLVDVRKVEAPGEAAGSVGAIFAVPAWRPVRFRVACDVKNPLCGPTGASRVYAPQKGAGPDLVEKLEAGLLHLAELLKRDLGKDILNEPGAGAAGGLGAGCMAFLQAEMVGGTDWVMGISRLSEHIAGADWLITGEGKIDRQTLQGKLVAGVAAMGRRWQKPVLAVCGSLELEAAQTEAMGIREVWSILDRAGNREEAMRNGAGFLQEIGYRIGKEISK